MRVGPVVLLAAGAFTAGALLATQPGRDEHQLVVRFVRAWEHDDVAQMYSLLDSRSRRHTSETAFARRLQAAADTATETALVPLRVESRRGNSIPVLTRVDTKLWGTLRETLFVPLRGSGSSARVRLAPQMLFPGLLPGEQLRRQIRLPPRATLLAADGETLAAGPDRVSPINDVAVQIVGTLGPVPPSWPATMRPSGTLRTPASATTAWSGSSRTDWPAGSAASSWPGAGCSPTPRRSRPSRSRRRSSPPWSGPRWRRSAANSPGCR